MLTVLVQFFLAFALLLFTTFKFLENGARENKPSDPFVPCNDPGVERLRCLVIRHTGLPVNELYRFKGHWYVNLHGSYTLVETLLRMPKYNAETLAEEAFENYTDSLSHQPRTA